MLTALHIWYLKRKLKAAILLRRSLIADYDCSPFLVPAFSPRVASLDTQINSLLGTLRSIDPNCPQ